MGETIPVELKLINIGETDVFVGRKWDRFDINAKPYGMSVWLAESSGKWSVGGTMIVDGIYPTKKEPGLFLEILLADWIVLPPGSALTKTIELDTTGDYAPPKPGRYIVKAKYRSSGMDYPKLLNPLALYKDEIRALPYPTWTGVLESNAVSVRLVAPTAARK